MAAIRTEADLNEDVYKVTTMTRAYLINKSQKGDNLNCVDVPEEHSLHTFPTEGVTSSVIMPDIDTVLREHLCFLTE